MNLQFLETYNLTALDAEDSIYQQYVLITQSEKHQEERSSPGDQHLSSSSIQLPAYRYCFLTSTYDDYNKEKQQGFIMYFTISSEISSEMWAKVYCAQSCGNRKKNMLSFQIQGPTSCLGEASGKYEGQREKNLYPNQKSENGSVCLKARHQVATISMIL